MYIAAQTLNSKFILINSLTYFQLGELCRGGDLVFRGILNHNFDLTKLSTKRKRAYSTGVGVIRLFATIQAYRSSFIPGSYHQIDRQIDRQIYIIKQDKSVYIYMLPIAGWTDWAEFFCGCYGVAGGIIGQINS